MKVALLHNPRPEDAGIGCRMPDAEDAFEEYDSPRTIARIAGAIHGLGVEVRPVVADRRLPWRLQAGRYDFAFNIAEGQGRRCREAIPAAVCELLGVPFTGSDALTLAVAMDKAVARRVVSPEVPVTRAVLVDGECRQDGIGDRLAALQYPVLVKPNDEGSSKGIRVSAVAGDVSAAFERCGRLRERYGCPVLVEEFLPGAEVTVGIVGNGPNARLLGTMEIGPATSRGPFVYSLEVKRDWRRQVRYHIPPRLDAATLFTLERHALTAYHLLGCRDFARLDFRLDAGGRPHFLECNPLPGLDPDNSDLVLLSQATVPYDRLVQGILLDAAQRTGVPLP